MIKTRVVKIGEVEIGGNSSIKIQSMIKIPTSQISDIVKKIIELKNIGCDIIRIAIQNKRDILYVEKIKNILIKKTCNIPIIADLHFYPEGAIDVVEFVDKIRINPGNFGKKDKFLVLIEKCKKFNKPIRIGVNWGSLDKEIIKKYGKTKEAMVKSCLEYAEMAIANNFFDLIFSLKTSNLKTTLKSHLYLIKKMKEKKYDFPIHIGITEAGEGIEGRIKSIIALGYLLNMGIGDTIRISLTEDPIEEIYFAKILLNFVKNFPISCSEKVYYKKNPIIVLNKDYDGIHKEIDALFGKKEIKIFSNRLKKNYSKKVIIKEGYIIKNNEIIFLDAKEKNIQIAKKLKEYSLKNKIKTILLFPFDDNLKKFYEVGLLFLNNTIDGVYINSQKPDLLNILFSLIEEVTDRSFLKPKYISCPGCGRTRYDIKKVVNDIKRETINYFADIKIAVMGCIVNGPGEMGDADFGIVGKDKKRVDIYFKNKRIFKNIDYSDGKKILLKMIKESIKIKNR